MSTEDSLKQSMDSAVKRYSSLFRLPSDREVFLLSALSCVGGGLLSALVLFPTWRGLTYGLLLGVAVFSASLAGDYAASTLVLKRGTIYDLRRTMALSLFCWAVWFLFIFLGAGLTVLLGSEEWWIRFCLMGFSVAIMLRLIVLSSTSAMNYARFLGASLLQPFLCMVSFLVFWAGIGNSITALVPAFLVFSVAVALVSTFIFLHLLDNVGKRALGMRPLSLFRAFMLNWVLGLNAPFEHLLEGLGEKRNVEACVLKFASEKPKAVIVVPSIHPGPFKNIGSSLLPSLLKTSLEKQLGCVACVPHGLLGHEFDLASQRQNEKVIEQAVASARSLEVSDVKASPFVKVTNGLATACCQVFGKSAIISFTLTPRTIEDLPEEIGLFVRDEAERRGLSFCAVVNAHNSIDRAAEMQDSLESLKNAATECLDKVVSFEQLPFEVGAATVTPKDFTLKDGMGPGGITAVVVRCGEQRAAYVVIDGNNMVSGLREDILSALKSMGVDEGEVFTTDTHSVSALILGGRGYHPIGEVMNREKLVSYIKEAVGTATSDFEPVRASCSGIEVADITVLGAKQLETLCSLIDKTVDTAKKIIAPIFVTAGLLLMLFLWFV